MTKQNWVCLDHPRQNMTVPNDTYRIWRRPGNWRLHHSIQTKLQSCKEWSWTGPNFFTSELSICDILPSWDPLKHVVGQLRYYIIICDSSCSFALCSCLYFVGNITYDITLLGQLNLGQSDSVINKINHTGTTCREQAINQWANHVLPISYWLWKKPLLIDYNQENICAF